MTRFRQALGLGIGSGPPVDEAFGHSLRVQDPDGAWVRIDAYDRELRT